MLYVQPLYVLLNLYLYFHFHHVKTLWLCSLCIFSWYRGTHNILHFMCIIMKILYFRQYRGYRESKKKYSTSYTVIVVGIGRKVGMERKKTHHNTVLRTSFGVVCCNIHRIFSKNLFVFFTFSHYLKNNNS